VYCFCVENVSWHKKAILGGAALWLVYFFILVF
jgi:hypothetical protein